MTDSDVLMAGFSVDAEKVRKETKDFMKSVKKSLQAKIGEIPTEWYLSLKLLETYYRQFIVATYQIESTDALTVTSKYGVVPNPILKIQQQAAVRLEKAMSELGLSLKSGKKLLGDVVQEELSPLEAFVSGKVEVR